MVHALRERDPDRLRWIAVLPGAILGGLLAVLSLSWVVPQTEMPGRVVQPFVAAAVFVWSGSMIAPRHRARTSIALVGVWMLLLAGFLWAILNTKYLITHFRSSAFILALMFFAVLFGPATGDWNHIPSEETIVSTIGA